jgi:hypothetical protein
MKLSTIALATAISLTPALALAQADSSERSTGAVGGATGGAAGGGEHLGADAVRHGRTSTDGTVGMAPDTPRTAPSTRMAPTQRDNTGTGPDEGYVRGQPTAPSR